MEKKKKDTDRQGGYTVLETIIAVSIFLVIITIGMGALLNTNLVHQKTQDMRSLSDTLSFIMDDMSRSLRTGSKYHCVDGTPSGGLFGTAPYSCPSGGWGISFKASDGGQWVYRTDSGIQKSVNGGTSFVSLTPSQIVVDPSSGFTVVGALDSDSLQPRTTIRLSGKITYKNVQTPFLLQTSVSQRLVDTP